MVTLTAMVALASACTVSASLDGKRCPCTDGYVCDEAVDRCIEQICEPAFAVTDFAPLWTTPNTILYRWVPTGEEEDFLRYEIVVANSLDDLADRTGTARASTDESHPELAHFRNPQASGTLVDRTSVRDLTPSTEYLARLYATDTRQCTSGSEVVTIRTADDAPGFVTLFEDEIPSGAFTLPQSGLVVDDGQLVYTPADDPNCAPQPGGDGQCGSPVRVQGLGIAASTSGGESPGVSAASFDDAFLEVTLANRGELPSYISEVWLWLDGCMDEATGIYEYSPFTLPGAEPYQTVQVPLSALRRLSDDEPLSFAAIDTQSAGTPVCGVGIGVQWNKTGTALVDDIRIRY